MKNLFKILSIILVIACVGIVAFSFVGCDGVGTKYEITRDVILATKGGESKLAPKLLLEIKNVSDTTFQIWFEVSFYRNGEYWDTVNTYTSSYETPVLSPGDSVTVYAVSKKGAWWYDFELEQFTYKIVKEHIIAK